MKDNLFVKEMQILWQNVEVARKNSLASLLHEYFGVERAIRIISKLQAKIEA